MSKKHAEEKSEKRLTHECNFLTKLYGPKRIKTTENTHIKKIPGGDPRALQSRALPSFVLGTQWFPQPGHF